jgi:hypothetical protein
MNDKFQILSIEETKNINGGRWGGPITALTYEIIGVISSNGGNLREAYENGRKIGCRGQCN